MQTIAKKNKTFYLLLYETSELKILPLKNKVY